jgi:HEAT repeat protein
LDTISIAAAISQLHASDKDARVAAALHLGKTADVSALDALLQSLAVEPELDIRETITWALVRLGHAAVTPLIQMLANPDPFVRHHAAHVLGKIGAPESVDPLIQSLGDSDPTVRMKAALSLGQIGDPKAIAFLIQHLGDADLIVQSTVNTAIEQFGEAAIAPLIDTLHDPHWHVRKQAAEVLGMIASDLATSALAQRLADEHSDVRFAAIFALHTIGSQNARHAIRTAIDDSDNRVRTLANRV